MFRTLLVIIALFCSGTLSAQSAYPEIDKLFETSARFNGVVLVARGDKVIYSRAAGNAYTIPDAPLTSKSRFIIGSVSKQVTAVLVLQAYEKRLVQLHEPIGKYLPDLPSWRDSVTIHHLLTHTHGIDEDNPAKPLAFVPGSRFEYSQVGYELLAKILEQVTGKPFAQLSAELFQRCGMVNSGVPGDDRLKPVAGCHEVNGRIVEIKAPSYIPPVAAGNFISSAEDLLRWNNCLHGGHLLKNSTYRMMITPQPNAIRNHPLFGTTYYGYGITVDVKDGLMQRGQTGMRAGFNSMDFYFPLSHTSVIVLSNVQYDDADLKKCMAFHTAVLQQLREKLKQTDRTKK